MLCKKPYMLGVLPCGCGQCLPCRINRRRLWAHRMMLEAAKHAQSAFVTLTYSQELLPSGSTLNPTHTTKWLKRLRKACYPQKLRYFIVGEYGDKTNRPHYHAAIFGLDPYLGGGSDGRSGIVNDTWKMGHVYTGDLTPQSASYICGYVTKKMTKKDDKRLSGRHPEYARMSLKPGIGADAMTDVAGSLEEHADLILGSTGTFPTVLQHASKKLPLGRYLRGILRQRMGYGRKTTDAEKLFFAEKMRTLFEEDVAEAKSSKTKIGEKSLAERKQKILQIENKFKIHDKRGPL